jgi:hypothetical protein
MLVTTAKWTGRPELVTSLPSWSCGFWTSSGAWQMVRSAWLAWACLSALVRAFLRDPVRGQVHPARQREWLPLDVQLDRQPGAAETVTWYVTKSSQGLLE